MDTLAIYSRYALIAEWLQSQVEERGYQTRINNLKGTKAAIIDISNSNDIERLAECDAQGIPYTVFSRHEGTKLLKLLFENEVKGFIHFDSSKQAITESLENAVQGGEYFDENALTFILSSKYREIYEKISSLSNRELEIIDGIMKDLTNDEIAEKYNLSVRTVNAHKRNILQKLKTRSLVGVVQMMLNYTMRYT